MAKRKPTRKKKKEPPENPPPPVTPDHPPPLDYEQAPDYEAPPANDTGEVVIAVSVQIGDIVHTIDRMRYQSERSRGIKPDPIPAIVTRIIRDNEGKLTGDICMTVFWS